MTQVQNYTVKSFERIIKEVAKDTTVDKLSEKAKRCRDKAWDLGGRMTNGRYTVPPVEDFKKALLKEM